MPRISAVQTNFTAGEISSRLLGREDVQRYSAGVSELINFRVMPHGGVSRRPGTKYAAEVKNSAEFAALVAFEHSVEQAYVLEFGNLYMRVYRNNGVVESGPGVPYEITTPYLHTEVRSMQVAQTADVMYLAHPSRRPRKLSRTGHTTWTLAQVSFVDGPYLSENTTSITITPSAATGSITLTASSAYFNSNMAPVGSELGALFRLKVGGNPYGYVRITGYTSATVVSAIVLSTLGGAAATTVWSEGAWSTYRGFPRSVTFFEQRLYFGGTSYQPQTLWGSAAGAYEDYTPGVVDDDAVTYTIASQRMNAIQWMFGRDRLFIGTAGNTYVAGDPTAPLTPTNVRIVPGPAFGSAHIAPVGVSSALLFVTRSKLKVRELVFEFRDDAYRAPDITLLAEHITQGALTQLAYAEEPDSLVFAVRNDGALLSATYDREQEIVAWSREDTDGLVESVAVISAPTGFGDEGYSQLWKLVNRTVGGATQRYVEYEAPPFEDSTAIEDAVFLDSALSYSGVATNIFAGLGHLEGKAVSVLADGAVQPDVVVTGGSVTIARAASVVHIGLSYISRLVTLPGVVGGAEGTAQGVHKSWGKIKARLHRSVGATINGTVVAVRTTTSPMSTAIQPQTETVVVQSLGWDEDAQVTIEQDKPLPTTVLSIFGNQLVEAQ